MVRLTMKQYKNLCGKFFNGEVRAYSNDMYAVGSIYIGSIVSKEKAFLVPPLQLPEGVTEEQFYKDCMGDKKVKDEQTLSQYVKKMLGDE